MGTISLRRQALGAFAFCVFMSTQGASPLAAQGAESSIYNVPMAEYPKVDGQRRAIFRLRAPEALSVQADICGKKYPMKKGSDGMWTVTTDPLVVGFHYYFSL